MTNDKDTTSQPLVSVVVPAYRVTEFIKETLDSVRAQTYPNIETIIVNDGTPDTAELEQVLRPYMNEIVYIKQENRGASAARNRGLQECSGSLIAFLDGDDLWLPEFVESQVHFIQSGPGYDLVYCNAFHFGNDCVGMTYMDTCPSDGKVNFESLITAKCNVISSGVLARKESLLRAGSFDESLRSAEDFDLWVRLARLDNIRINYQRRVLVGYRHRSGSLSTDFTRHLEQSLRVFEKILTREDLTSAERRLVGDTLTRYRARLAVRKGKAYLLEGDFAEATQSFKSAQSLDPNWKLSMALAFMRISPSVVQRVYRRAI